MASLTDSGSEFQNGRSTAETGLGMNGYAQPHMLGLVEVAGILRVQPEQLQWLSQAYADSLSPAATQPIPQYTHDDLATLINAQRLETEAAETVDSPSDLQSDASTSAYLGSKPTQSQAGYVPSQFDEYRPQDLTKSSERTDRVKADDAGPSMRLNAADDLADGVLEYARPAGRGDPILPSTRSVADEPDKPLRQSSTEPASVASVTANLSAAADHSSDEAEPASLEISTPLSADKMLGEMLSTVATSQQSVLNVQDSIREMLNVIAQDNFNLKHENRKLRERMLELERVIAEHQRREETRKEMLESRMRAVEGTLSALQQQLAQLVQLQRQRIRKNWFKQ